ncbi:putative phosphoprotein [Cytorhabdovirus tiliae]|uniref:Phosphoprotein n=1 Tax=Cytorhabdovirus sp. 'tiliae' TaxID=3004219 RepID=A0A9J7CAP3_9RHAB|nr:putative phosphoprotein [Cytorhabdovirus tiliae]
MLLRYFEIIVVKSVLFLFWVIDIFDAVNQILLRYSIIMTTPIPPAQLAAIARLAPPSDESLKNLNEDLYHSVPAATQSDVETSQAKATPILPEVQQFFSNASAIANPEKIGKYRTHNEMLKSFEVILKNRTLPMHVEWSDTLVRKYNLDSHKVDVMYLEAFADGILAARQTSLEGPMTEASERLTQGVKQLEGVKLDFDSQVKELRESLMNELLKTKKEILESHSKVTVSKPSHDEEKEKFVKQFLMKLKFGQKALEYPEFIKAITNNFSYQTIISVATGNPDVGYLIDLQNQAKAIAATIQPTASK